MGIEWAQLSMDGGTTRPKSCFSLNAEDPYEKFIDKSACMPLYLSFLKIRLKMHSVTRPGFVSSLLRACNSTDADCRSPYSCTLPTRWSV